ncbi:carboxypeptidase-like regulatory domain-containing protein [Tunturiibacter gelidiferens]|uniref:Carboxypeptidase-like regulatory domain-containing protein n=1 Tax=Tunturiibacter gelidiferens TaxID=3069689 RepID=A0AAU7YXT4_9BACT
MHALRIFGAGCLGRIAALGLAGFSSFSYAWQSAPVVAGGTVTGHVICGDTQRPARFAKVILFGVPAEITPPPKPGVKGGVVVYYKKAIDALNMIDAQTDLEGGFALHGVAPGDYYAFASVSGYVRPSQMVLAAYEAGSDLHYPISGIPAVHVVSERSAQVDLTVERGAAIAGKVMWDDGSPAARLMVTVIAAKGKKEVPIEFSMLSGADGMEQMSFSDDRGHFRISGLAHGDYFVRGDLTTKSRTDMKGGANGFNGRSDSPLVVFAPAAFHQADAKAITVHRAEERDDVEMTINLKGLYAVSGRVSSSEDHHGINEATVRIEDAQDKEFFRSTNVDANGDFTVTFVPPGSYSLVVQYAGDTEPANEKPSDPTKMNSETVLRSYEDGKQAVVVTDSDVTGRSLELVPTKIVKKSLFSDE